MVDAQDFVSFNYGNAFLDMPTVEEFNEWKKEQNIEEWDYPLDEYNEIALHHKEDGTNYVPVRFKGDGTDYEYRFCEIPGGKNAR